MDNYLYEYVTDNIKKISNKLKDIIQYINKLTEERSKNIFKHISINSAFRNRTLYPLESNFVIPYTNGEELPRYSFDSVSLSLPVLSFVSNFDAISTTQIKIGLYNYQNNKTFFPKDTFVNDYIEINGEYRKIIAYDQATTIATVDQAFTFLPLTGMTYNIRYELPMYYGVLQAGNTQDTLIFDVSASSVDNYYSDKYIYLIDGPAKGQVSLITEYNGTTKKAKLKNPLTIAPGTDKFDINNYSYNNGQSLRYSGTIKEQETCYSVQLLQLNVPYQILKVGRGGTVATYPYLYIHFYNENNAEFNMYGNNPHSKVATFKVIINGNSIMKYYFGENLTVAFNNVAQSAVQNIKFNPNSLIRFKVTLPNGEALQFKTDDNKSPFPPNPLLQISALIGIKKVI